MRVKKSRGKGLGVTDAGCEVKSKDESHRAGTKGLSKRRKATTRRDVVLKGSNDMSTWSDMSIHTIYQQSYLI